jgi:hypothetical protein
MGTFEIESAAMSELICPGSRKLHSLSVRDEPDDTGKCGVCGKHVPYELKEGQWVPILHLKPEERKKRKKAIPGARGRKKNRRVARR